MSEPEPTLEQLVDFVTNRLAEPDATRMGARVASSPELATRASRLRDIVEVLRGDDGAIPPAAEIRRALELLPIPTATSRSAWLDTARRSAAEIVFDSRDEPERVGFGGPAFHVAYEGEAGRVDLQVRPAHLPNERIWRVRGQVSAGSDARIGALVVREADSTRDVAVCDGDDDGGFRIDIPAGAYDLLVAIDDRRVVLTLPGLVIGALEPS